MLRKFGVQKLLTFIVVAWGTVQLGMGFVHAWGWLVLCRVLLGIFEVWQNIFFVGARLDYLFDLASGCLLPSTSVHSNHMVHLFLGSL